MIRNALVHNPSSFNISAGCVNVNYKHKKTNFSIKISSEILEDFYTAIVMYIKGDMGQGNYFLGIMRSIYANVLAGIRGFSDEFGSTLEKPSSDIKIKPHVRQIFSNPPYEISDGIVCIDIPEKNLQKWEGIDFYISYNGDDFLIPMEALSEDLSIAECDFINNWKREGYFPHVKTP